MTQASRHWGGGVDSEADRPAAAGSCTQGRRQWTAPSA